MLAVGGSSMDLGRAPLMDVHIAAEPGGGRWLALVRMQHMMLDHTALEVLLAEVRAFLSGRGDLLAAPLPFRDFVAQARLGMRVGSMSGSSRSCWVTSPRPRRRSVWWMCMGTAVGAVGCVCRWMLSWRVGCGAVARRLGASPATVFHLAWARVLAAVAGREDVVFGTVLFGRMNAGAGADRVPGPFINTLPVRVRVSMRGVLAGAWPGCGGSWRGCWSMSMRRWRWRSRPAGWRAAARCSPRSSTTATARHRLRWPTSACPVSGCWGEGTAPTIP